MSVGYPSSTVTKGLSAPSQDPRSRLERRVAAAAEAALERQQFVSPVDVLVGIGWVPSTVVERWRRGVLPDLERAAAVGGGRLAAAVELLGRWARAGGLLACEVDYVAGTRDRRPLRFTADGDPAVERAYRTHWIPSALSEPARTRLTRRLNAAPELVVISPVSEWTCAECAESGDLLILEDDRPLCMTCADLDHLVFLAAGDAALTRRARKASSLSAVVLRFSRSRKRYERRGILVEQAALEAAEQQCLGDAEARLRRRELDARRRTEQDLDLARRTTQEIIRLFPACPRHRAEAIAAHTGVRGSGRVGRSAAGRALAVEAIEQAVVASIRHQDTGYDQLLMSGVPRTQARQRVRADIDQVLDSWRRHH